MDTAVNTLARWRGTIRVGVVFVVLPGAAMFGGVRPAAADHALFPGYDAFPGYDEPAYDDPLDAYDDWTVARSHDDGGTVVPGETVVFTVDFTNITDGGRVLEVDLGDNDDPPPGLSHIFEQCSGDLDRHQSSFEPRWHMLVEAGDTLSCSYDQTVPQDAQAGDTFRLCYGYRPVPADLGAGNCVDLTVLAQAPGISLEKSGSGAAPLTVGANVEYTFVVTNVGNVTLSEVTVGDPLSGLSPIACPDDTLAPDAEMTCTASYTVTEADVEAGMIENTATVTGQPPGDGSPPTDESTTTVPTEPVPALPPVVMFLLVALLSASALWGLRRARA